MAKPIDLSYFFVLVPVCNWCCLNSGDTQFIVCQVCKFKWHLEFVWIVVIHEWIEINFGSLLLLLHCDCCALCITRVYSKSKFVSLLLYLYDRKAKYKFVQPNGNFYLLIKTFFCSRVCVSVCWYCFQFYSRIFCGVVCGVCTEK